MGDCPKCRDWGTIERHSDHAIGKGVTVGRPDEVESRHPYDAQGLSREERREHYEEEG